MFRLILIAVFVVGLSGIRPATSSADDDPIPPPLDPGNGSEGLLPAPNLPPWYDRDQDTIPYGVQSVANTPVLHLGQSFRPSLSSIDWVAFVFQNTVQPSDPNPPGPGFLQVGLYTGINSSNGALSGLLAKTEVASIASQTTSWVVFHFADSISLVPGNLYYLHVEQTGGYQSWIGIRGSSIYSNGNAFGYFYDTVFNNPPQNLNWGGRDLHFAQGILASVAGDFDSDGDVDGADFVAWQSNFPLVSGATPAQGDADGDGDVDGADFVVWQTNFPTNSGAAASPIPEPSAVVLVLLSVLMMEIVSRCRSPHGHSNRAH